MVGGLALACCHCEEEPTNCFGCTGEVPNSISANLGSWSWGITSPETYTDNWVTGDTFLGGPCFDVTTTVEYRTRNINLLDGSKSLVKHADADCFWHFVDFHVWEWKGYDGANDETCAANLTEIGSYVYSWTPTSGMTFSPVPDGVPNVSDTDCDTAGPCGFTIRCESRFVGVDARLMVDNLTETDPDVYSSGGTPHWVLSVGFRVSSLAWNKINSKVTCPSPPGQSYTGSLNASIGTTKTDGVARIDPSSDPDRTISGGMATYIKEIDCANDFDGSARTLSLANYIGSGPGATNVRTKWGITAPSTVTITL